MTALAVLSFLRKHLSLVAVGLLLLYVAVLKGEVRHLKATADHAKAQAKLCEQGRKADRKAWADGQIAARKLAQEQKARTEARFAQIQKESTDAYKAQLADARARLRQWMRSAQGDPRQADLRGNPDAAPGPDGVSGAAFMVAPHDLELCTSAVIKLEGWQAWFRSIQKTEGN